MTNIGEARVHSAERRQNLYAANLVPRRPNALGPPTGKPALLRRIGDLPPLGPATGTVDATIRDTVAQLAAVRPRRPPRGGRPRCARVQLDGPISSSPRHGYFYGEHGLSDERRLAYEEAIRLPLFIRYPRVIKAGLTPAQFARRDGWQSPRPG